MKSYNHLWEKFISDDNIRLAIKNVCKHKSNCKKFRELKENPDANIEWIRSYAINFKNAEHTPIEIYDGIQRKKRTIIVPTFEEQIIHHMVVNVLKPIIMRPMYEHSYGSIPNRGATLGSKHIKKWLTKDKVMLLINDRGKDTALFWFTLFHELKHVLQKKLKAVYLTTTKEHKNIFRLQQHSS